MTDIEEDILNKANTFFRNIGVAFTISPSRRHENMYLLQSTNSMCDVKLSIVPNDHIYISSISKCDGMYSGTKLLQHIIEFGKYIQVRYIELVDGSMISSNTCSSGLPFTAVDILTTGTSWYNKFGFVNNTTYTDNIYNAQIANSVFNDVINEDILTRFNTVFFVTDGHLVKNVLSTLKELYLNKTSTTELTHGQCDVLTELFMYLENIIQYNPKLKLQLMHGGKRVTKRKKYKKKRTKNRR